MISILLLSYLKIPLTFMICSEQCGFLYRLLGLKSYPSGFRIHCSIVFKLLLFCRRHRHSFFLIILSDLFVVSVWFHFYLLQSVGFPPYLWYFIISQMYILIYKCSRIFGSGWQD